MEEMKGIVPEQQVQQNDDAKKCFGQIGLIFMLGTIGVYASQFILGEVISKYKPEWLEDSNISLIFSAVTLYAFGILLIYLLLKKMPVTVPVQHKMKKGSFMVALIMCYAATYCMNFVGVIITGIIGMIKGSPVQNVGFDMAMNTNIVLLVVYVVIIAPIFEELIFRKMIVDRTLRYGEGVSILVSGLMFGLFHGNLNQFVYALVLGCFFAFLYVRTGNVKITIGLHMIVNFFGSVASQGLLKAVDYDRFMELTNSGADEAMLMEYMMEHLAGWMLFGLYAIALLAIVVAGVVLWIVFRKRFKLMPVEQQIPKGQVFKTAFCNVGMALFVVVWIGLIVAQLFM